jgi:chromosomal replication initiator protein
LFAANFLRHPTKKVKRQVLSIWAEFLKLAKQEVGTQVIETWFKCVSLQNFSPEQHEVTLCAPNQFVTSWLTRHYLELIKRGLGQLLSTENLKISFIQTKTANNLKFSVNGETRGAPTAAETEVAKILPAKKPVLNHQLQEACLAKKDLGAKKIGISTKYRFDTFVVGPHNHLAYSASLAISKGAIKGYNPLFIYGPTGLGKTHLLNCIGNETRELKPNAKIVYKTSDKFVDEFIKSIRFDRIDQFKEKYCTTDLLLIDDIQFLSQKEQTQEIFFHIFNNMHQQNKQIVLSSDLPPSHITGLQDRLKSRFGWGLIADIAPPAFETRVAILIKKADEMKIDLPSLVAEKIAAKASLNIRELEGMLTRLSTLSILSGIPIADYPIDKEIGQQKPLKGARNTCPNELMRSVAKAFNISPIEIKSDRREKNVSDARQLLMYFLREHTNFSLKNIGDFVGGRSHSTVLHAIETIKERIDNDTSFFKQVKTITDQLSHKPPHLRSSNSFIELE